MTERLTSQAQVTEALEAADAFIKAEHDFHTYLGRGVHGSNRDLGEAVARGERYKDTKKKAEKLVKSALALTVEPQPSPVTELVEALALAHRQVDMLMAMVITLDPSFMPSKTSLWPDIVARVELIRKHSGEQRDALIRKYGAE